MRLGSLCSRGVAAACKTEFGALNALVLVALESGREPAKREREMARVGRAGRRKGTQRAGRGGGMRERETR